MSRWLCQLSYRPAVNIRFRVSAVKGVFEMHQELIQLSDIIKYLFTHFLMYCDLSHDIRILSTYTCWILLGRCLLILKRRLESSLCSNLGMLRRLVESVRSIGYNF